MTEHEKLKKICDKIGYIYNVSSDNFVDFDNNIINIREIIFTQEFMDKYRKYINKDLEFGKGIILHLDNPVDYLYDLIF